MTFLGKMSGTGQVVVDGEEVGEVDYEISVHKPGAMREAMGRIKGDEGLIWAVYQSDTNATLHIEGGGTVDFLVRRSSVGSGEAEIRVSGPVPGISD